MSSFDDIIRQKADGHEAPVPPDAWDKIMPRKKKRRFIFWLWMLAALIIAGVGTPAYLHWQKKDTARQAITAIPQQHNPSAVEQQKKNNPENINVVKETAAAVTNVNTGSAATTAMDQNTNDKTTIGTTTTTLEKDNHPAEQNKKTITTKAKTIATIHAAEIATADILSNSTVGNDQKKSFRKNKIIAKRTNKKTTAQITEAETGETAIQTVEEKPLPKEPGNNKTTTTEQQPSKEKITTAEIAETKKTDSNTITKQPEPQPATTVAKKTETKKRSLFAEFSFLPFLPTEQSNTAAPLARSAFNNMVLSEFKSNSIKTTLEPSVAFQLALRKNISSRWQIGAGVQYAQLKETIHLSGEETTTTYGTINRLVVEPSRSYLVTDTIETITEGTREINAVNSYQLISVPLFAQYHAGKLLGCNISFTGGLFFNVYNHYSNSINPIVSSGANSNNNALGIDVYGGLRLSKLYGQKIELFAEPTVRFNLNQPNIKNALLSKQIKQAGVAVGVAVKLN
jgi:hypothetical protein